MYNYAYLHTDGKFFFGIVWTDLTTIYKCKTEREKFFALQLLDSCEINSIQLMHTAPVLIRLPYYKNRGGAESVLKWGRQVKLYLILINYNDDIQ